MAAESREESVYVPKRYDGMVEAMEKVAKTVDVEELTVEERNLLSVAYKKRYRGEKSVVEDHFFHRAEGGEQRQ